MKALKIEGIQLLSDLTTPVSVFLKLREHFSEIVLLESSDYSGEKNSLSFIAFDSLFTLMRNEKGYQLEDKIQGLLNENFASNAVEAVNKCLELTQCIEASLYHQYIGWFGFTSFDMVNEFEKIPLSNRDDVEFPLLRYDFFRYILVFDHFYESLYLLECKQEETESGLHNILSIISRQDHQTYSFKSQGEVQSTTSEIDFKEKVETAKSHCQRGDVFQLVLSRRFHQTFSGDEFNVYRALRSVNPSPYLFYFDYTTFKIFGSSPETQITTEKGIAEVHPIAGTFKRTGDDKMDAASALDLVQDTKENAEHTMLVDLARNDLSKNCMDVRVMKYKEIQYFSHVIHLVSKVQGQIKEGVCPYQVFVDTFPAGTLSGAPKNRALNLINSYEPHSRMIYGGGIGMIKLNGDINHAIVIRSFFSRNKSLYWQAGAGIVINSEPEKESQEVYNKLGALQQAILKAGML